MTFNINPAKFGILVVDMQTDFIKDIKEQDIMELITFQQQLFNICLKKDYPVAVLEYKSKGRTIQELLDTIKTIPRHEFFVKECDDGFENNHSLEVALRNWNLETLCITGINAACCVLNTAIGGIQKGYKVMTSQKLIASSDGQIGVKYAQDWFCKSDSFFDRANNRMYYTDHKNLIAQLNL